MPINTPPISKVVTSDTFTQLVDKTNELINIVNGLPAAEIGHITRFGGVIDGGTNQAGETNVLVQEIGSFYISGQGEKGKLGIGDFLTLSGRLNDLSSDIDIIRVDRAASINVVSSFAGGTGTANLSLQGTGNSAVRFLDTSTSGMVLGYDGDAYKLDIKSLSGGTETDKFTFTKAGEFGIGTTSPQRPLHVTNSIDILATFESTDSFAGIEMKDNHSNHWILGSHSGKLRFRYMPGDHDRLVINNAGNVGIGTDNPATLLELEADKDATIRLSSTLNSSTWTPNVDTIGAIEFYGNDLSGVAPGVRNYIKSIVEWDTQPGYTTGSKWGLSFGTSFNNASPVERLRIDATGRVGISTSEPSAPLHIATGDDVSLTSNGFLMLGSAAGTNLILDDNEIQARNGAGIGATAATLFIQERAGNLTLINDVEATDSVLSVGKAAFGTTGDQRIAIFTNDLGRVGINKNSPQRTLDVVGTFRVARKTGPGTGQVEFTDTLTSASSATSGNALQVTGGVGIGANLNVGGVAHFRYGTSSNPAAAIITNGGALQVISGGASIKQDLVIGGKTVIYDGSHATLGSAAAAATAPGVAALTVLGGIAVGETCSYDGAAWFTYSAGAYLVDNVSDTMNQGSIRITAGGLVSQHSIRTNASLYVRGTTDSTSIGSGAVQIAGGVGIAKRVNIGSAGVDSRVKIYDNTSSSSHTVGALTVAGGVGISENLNVGASSTTTAKVKINDTTTSTSTTSGALQVRGGVGIAKRLHVGVNIPGTAGVDGYDGYSWPHTTNISRDGDVRIMHNEHASLGFPNASTGSLYVRGGITTSSDSNFGGRVVIGSRTDNSYVAEESSTVNDGSLRVKGGVGIGGNLNAAGTATNYVKIHSSLTSTSSSSGALQVVGGVGVAGALHIGATSSTTSEVIINDTTDGSGTTLTSMKAATTALVVAGGAYINRSLMVKDYIRINTTTGAQMGTFNVAVGVLRILGGASISGNSHFNNKVQIGTALNQDSSSAITGSLQVVGGVGISGGITTGTTATSLVKIKMPNTGDGVSSSTTTGALVVTGGVGIGGALNAGTFETTGAAIIGGALSATGGITETTGGLDVTGLSELKSGLTVTGAITTLDDLRINGSLHDGTNIGAAGDVLHSDGSVVYWDVPTASGAAIGSGATGKMALWTGSGTVGSSIMTQVSSKIGIGTGALTPSGLLEVYGPSANIYISNSQTNQSGIIFRDGTDRVNNTEAAAITFDSNQSVGNKLRFYNMGAVTGGSFPTGSVRMTIDNAGQVGIGDDSPSYKLDVSGDFRATGTANCDSTLTVIGNTTLRGKLYDGETVAGSFGSAGSAGMILSSTASGVKWISQDSVTPGFNSGLIVGGGTTTLNQGLTVTGSSGLNYIVQIQSTEDALASNDTTAALSVAGGVAIGEQLRVGGNVTLDNDKNLILGGTGAFTSGTGNVLLNGDVTIANNKDLTLGGTGTFTTGTGLTTLGGGLDVTAGDVKVKDRLGIGPASASDALGFVPVDAELEIRKATGATIRLTSNKTAIASDLLIGELQFYSKDSSTPNISSYIKSVSGGTSGQARLEFGTSAAGLDATTEMWIMKDGAVGIGSSPGAYKLDVDGTFNSTALATLHSLTVAGLTTHNGNVLISGAGTFTSGTGNVLLNGDVTIANNKDLTLGGTGTFTSGTGAVLLKGDVAIDGAGTFTSGTGAVLLKGDVGIVDNKNLSMSGTGTLTTGTGDVKLRGYVAIGKGSSNYGTPKNKFEVLTGETGQDMRIGFAEDASNKQSIIFSEDSSPGWLPFFSIQHDGTASSPGNLLKFRAASGSSGVFDVDAITIAQDGDVTLGGDVTIATNKSLDIGGTGHFSTGTAYVHLNGHVTIANDKQLNVGATGTSAGQFNIMGAGTFSSGTGDSVFGGEVHVANFSDLRVSGKLGFGHISSSGSPVETIHMRDHTGLPSKIRFDLASGSVAAGTMLGEIQFYSEDTEAESVSSFVRAAADGNAGEGALLFGTSVGGFQVDALEKMRINKDGNVDIGTSAVGTHKLHVAGTVKATGDVNVGGDLDLDGDIIDSSGMPGSQGQVLSPTGGGTVKWIPNTVTALYPPGFINGYRYVSDSTDEDHDVQVFKGSCASSDGTTNLNTSATSIKSIDATWVTGPSGGGMPSGILPAVLNTWYRVMVVGGAAVTAQIGFDTSATAANILSDAGAGYNKFRQIGWIRTDAAINVQGFYSAENYPNFIKWQKSESLTDPSRTQGWVVDVAQTVDATNCAPPNTLAEISFGIMLGTSNGNDIHTFNVVGSGFGLTQANPDFGVPLVGHMLQSNKRNTGAGVNFTSNLIRIPLGSSQDFYWVPSRTSSSGSDGIYCHRVGFYYDPSAVSTI